MIRWNGHSSDEFGVVVQAHPTRTLPTRKMNVYSIPGRSGDIIEVEDAYENYEQTYKIFLEGDDYHNLQQRAEALGNWLMAPSGYCALEDSYEPNSFRYAYFKGPVNITPYFNEHGTAEITFTCNPKRFLHSGQLETLLTGTTNTVINDTCYPAKPLIRLVATSGSIHGDLTINGTRITFKNNYFTEILFDFETGNATNNGSSCNQYVLGATLPSLVPGENTITWNNSNVKLYLTPRWWVL